MGSSGAARRNLCASLLLVYLLPLDNLSRYIEFKRNEAEFTQIIERIHAGTLAPESVVPNAYQRRRDYRTGNKKLPSMNTMAKKSYFSSELIHQMARRKDAFMTPPAPNRNPNSNESTSTGTTAAPNRTY